MRIVMLGWEFPPFISGGLGTACYGLTKALDAQGHDVLFVLPRAVDRSLTSHIRLLSPDSVASGGGGGGSIGPEGRWVHSDVTEIVHHRDAQTGAFAHTRFVGVPAGFRSPYASGGAVGARGAGAKGGASGQFRTRRAAQPDGTFVDITEEILWFDEHDEELHHARATFAAELEGGGGHGGAGMHYRGDLIADSERYARLVVALARREEFDVIHAHDWLTFPAGQALARVTGKPFIAHVHSTEFDRAGDHVNQRVYDIERRGMTAATRVFAVSEYTKAICVTRYGAAADKVDVVYNGIDSAHQPPPGSEIKSKDRIVLFLGRITMQKGPEYFIGAARRVLEKVPEAKFIMAGSGDMELRMIELAAQYGIGARVLFTGFLRGGDVDRVYRMAECYVMPSVSEPFGIAPLEAMRNDVPVIISKQSGVSEVLVHALKVDFWDIDAMANLIVAVLKYPPLGETLREHGGAEIRRLTWDGAAKVCVEGYGRAVEEGERVAGMLPG
ncbi:hypothetical protein BH11PLA1_BH11PLA1_07480 [soil metagenome]